MNKKKIALVGFRLCGGGSDRVMATLSHFFSSKGYDVHIIIFHDELGFEYSGTLFNLGKFKNENNTFINKIKRFRRFKNYIKQHQFDKIIDFRFRINLLQEYFISKFVYASGAYYTIHSSHLQTYLPKRKFLANTIYSSKHTLVTVSKAIKNLVEKAYGFKHVLSIYNPINIENISTKTKEKVDLNFEYIIAMGRFDTDVKQFDVLIQAYSKSVLPSKNLHLVILGKGELLHVLKTQMVDLKLESKIHFLGFQDNPFKYLANAKFYVLTSKYEGFPMVLLESLACDTPVVSFDLPSGPNEIIKHKHNGLLVKNQDKNDLVNAINLFVADTDLYKHCKANAKRSIEGFTISATGNQWLKLLQLDE